MANNTNDFIYVTTPIATLNYPYLVKQDTKFDPKWCVTLQFDPKNNPEHKKFLAELKKLNEDSAKELLNTITKGKSAYRTKDIIKADEDSEGNPTGTYSVKVSTKHKPQLYDSKGAVIPDEVGAGIWGGSKGRVAMALKKSIAANQKTVGLTLYFNKVQVTEIVRGTGGSTDSENPSGFSTIEGGFTVDTAGTQVDGGDY